jgi:hypothetical protein
MLVYGIVHTYAKRDKRQTHEIRAAAVCGVCVSPSVCMCGDTMRCVAHRSMSHGYRDNNNNEGTHNSPALSHTTYWLLPCWTEKPIGYPALSNRHSGTWTLSSRCREGERKPDDQPEHVLTLPVSIGSGKTNIIPNSFFRMK